MTYRQQATPLHAARASVAGGYCLALAGAAFTFDHPVLLAALLLAVIMAGSAARAGYALARTLRIALPLMLVAAILNPIFSHQGLTVIARLGSLPVLGEIDLTLEALVFGAAFALKLIVVLLACALAVATVDPDEALRASRRLSFRSALSASLATRMWPLLHADAERRAEALRCRADSDATTSRAARTARKAQVLQATVMGALDRALDVAATLEVRGYAIARMGSRARRPWSRHDLAFATAGLALIGLAVTARLGGVGRFDTYPSVHAALGPAELIVGAALIAIAVLPFANRRGVTP